MNASRYGLTFHHFAIALRSLDEASRFLGGLGYTIGRPVFDPEQGVSVAMCFGPDLPALELVLGDGGAGPVHNLLKRQESVIYHACYFSAAVERSLEAIAEDGLTVKTLSPAKPAVLFCGAPVSFHYVSGFGLIEIIHSAEAPAIAT
jgi:glyoxalase/bleomycin resistance protein/dioxygenase superfamily protein